jgi:hypothetical protein
MAVLIFNIEIVDPSPRLRKGSVRVGFKVDLLRPVRVGFIRVRGLGEPFPLGSG